MQNKPLLPWWDTDRDTWKLWKSALKRVGKARTFSLLAPTLLELSERITDTDHSAWDKSRSIQPSERKRLVVEAINELRRGEPGVASTRICRMRGEFTNGVKGETAVVLCAFVALIEAMGAPRKFERHLYGCIHMLGIIDRELIESFRHALCDDPVA